MPKFKRCIWEPWWDKLQQDIADCLQNRILNFDTILGLSGLLIMYFYPSLSTLVGGTLGAYGIVRNKI